MTKRAIAHSCAIAILALLGATPAASMEHIDPADACFERGSNASLILYRMQLGKTPIPEQWDARRWQALQELVEGAKVWPRGVEDYGRYIYLDCLDQARKGSFRKTVSSQPLPAPSPAQRVRCLQKLHDTALIGRAVVWRKSRETSRFLACIGDVLDEQRRAKILRLIDEAYAASNVQAWYDDYYGKCLRAEPEFIEGVETPEQMQALKEQNDASCRQATRESGVE